MNSVAAAGLLAGFLMAPGQVGNSPPVPLPVPSAERIESGKALSASGEAITYRIRLLPLASFPNLPAPVAAELSHRQCVIPQSFEAKQPENVIHGAFHAAGSSDWAALCSSAGTTTLYVFFDGQVGSTSRIPPGSEANPAAPCSVRPGASPFGRPPNSAPLRSCAAPPPSTTTPSTMPGSSAPRLFTITRPENGSISMVVTAVISLVGCPATHVLHAAFFFGFSFAQPQLIRRFPV
jgi:hypothetical protein